MNAEEKHIRDQARRWWDKIGRALVRREANIEVTRRVGPGVIVRGREQVLPSGILMGARWADLTPREQQKVMDAWRANFHQPQTGPERSTTDSTALQPPSSEKP